MRQPDQRFPELMFRHYDQLIGKCPDFGDIQEPRAIFVQRIDYYLSVKRALGETNVFDSFDKYFSGGLLRYLIHLHEFGFLGKFGYTTDVVSFLMNFPATKISLLWIPKNSCTTIKKILSRFEPPELQSKIKPGAFHESCQALFGPTPAQFVNSKLFPLVCLIRHPFERVVSCYLDKIANPIIRNGPFEPFIKGHIFKAQAMLGLVSGDLDRSISFAEFLYYIDSAPAWLYDAHWRPQTCFVHGLQEVTRFIMTDNLDAIWQMLGLEPVNLEFNKSFGRRFDESEPCTGEYAELLPSQLAGKSIGSYNQFINGAALRILNGFYEDDLALVERARLSPGAGPRHPHAAL